MLLFSYVENGFHIHHTLDEHPNDRLVLMHAHTNCELYYLISGEGYYTVEGNTYNLSPGSIMIMRDGETHKLHITDSMPYERIAVHFNPESLPFESDRISKLFFDRPLGKGNLIECSESSRKFIVSCFNRLCRASDSNSPDRILAYLVPILYEISRPKRSDKQKNDSFDVPEKESLLVVKIIEYINEHLTEIKGLAEIEQNFYFSASYLNKIFKNNTGSTIWNYIVLKRLLNAQNEIKNGRPAAVAAAMNGFGDYSSFYRQYKAHFGASPTLKKASVQNQTAMNTDQEL